MVKAGYKSSNLNEIIWMGNVVNEAVKLGNWGNDGWFDHETLVSEKFFKKLDPQNQNLLNLHLHRDCYQGDIKDRDMYKWYKENCKD